MLNDKKEEQAKKIAEKEQKQRDVVNCFLKSISAMNENFTMAAFVKVFNSIYGDNLNSTTVNRWVSKYIGSLESKYKVELENSSFKKLETTIKHLNKKIGSLNMDKILLEKEKKDLKNNNKNLGDKNYYLCEEIDELKFENQRLKEEINYLKEELNRVKDKNNDKKMELEAIATLIKAVAARD